MAIALDIKTPALSAFRRPVRWRAVAIVALTLVAYHHTFSTLFSTLLLDTPLAYLGLVPVIALGMAFVLWRRQGAELPIHDRQLDYIIAVPLLVGALLVNLVLPKRMSTMFWFFRVDVLTLPLFVAGAVVLLMGTRAVWRLRAAIAFLVLAWPYPYTLAVYNWLDTFTSWTIKAVAAVVGVIPLATHDPTGDGSLFIVHHGSGHFTLSVASACSGANGLLGFVLIAGAVVLAKIRGPRIAKIAWLLVGSALIWLLNVARILIIFFVGKSFGEHVAVDGFHPFVGVIMFVLGVLVMLLLLRPFRLRVEPGPAKTALPGVTLPGAGGRLFAASLVALLVVPLYSLNSGLARFDLVADNLGGPRLQSFTSQPAELVDFTPAKQINQFDWSRRYFGDSSTWLRYNYLPLSRTPQSNALWTSTSVIADVVETGDRNRFSVYGLEACYRFHHYAVDPAQTVDLGGGIVGTALSWRDGGKVALTWTTVYWIWPVKEKGHTRYERMVLLIGDNGKVEVRAPNISLNDAGSRLNDALSRGRVGSVKVSDRQRELRGFLVAMARDIVRHQAAAPKT